MEKRELLLEEQSPGRMALPDGSQSQPLLHGDRTSSRSKSPSELEKLEKNTPLSVRSPQDRSSSPSYHHYLPVMPIQLPPHTAEDSDNDDNLESRELRYSPSPIINAEERDPDRRKSALQRLQNEWKPLGARPAPYANNNVEENVETRVNMNASISGVTQGVMNVEGKQVKLMPPDSVESMVLPFEPPSPHRVRNSCDM